MGSERRKGENGEIKKVCIPDQSSADRTSLVHLHFNKKIMRNQYVCTECHGNFDPGELSGRICPECLAKMLQKELARQEESRRREIGQIRQEEMIYE